MRIVFEGELSEKNKKYFERGQDRDNRITMLIVAVLILVPVTLLVVKCGLYFISLYSLNIIFVVGAFVPIKKQYREGIYPEMIIIEGEDLKSLGKNSSVYKKMYDVKEVEDLGDSYRILFDFPGRSPMFLCQKDLITEGTIEDFEELFADKIVRKTEQN